MFKVKTKEISEAKLLEVRTKLESNRLTTQLTTTNNYIEPAGDIKGSVQCVKEYIQWEGHINGINVKNKVYLGLHFQFIKNSFSKEKHAVREVYFAIDLALLVSNFPGFIHIGLPLMYIKANMRYIKECLKRYSDGWK
jgi:hypothetical protein